MFPPLTKSQWSPTTNNRDDGGMVDKFAILKCFEKIIDAGKIVPDQRYGFVVRKNEVESSISDKYDLYITEIKEK